MARKLTREELKKRKRHHEKRAEYYRAKIRDRDREERTTGFRVPWKDNRSN